jgi:Spy/CpxP family protein refolding chaperone
MVRRIQKLLTAVALVALSAGRSGAQQASCERCSAQQASCEHGGRVMGPPPLMFLAQKSVQQDLKLSDEQIKKIGEALTRQREEFNKLRELPREERDKKYAELFGASCKLTKEIVNCEQGHRLRQIIWQQQGALAFGCPEVAKALELTSEQKEKIQAIHQELRDAGRKLFAAEQAPPREEIHKKMKDLHKDAAAKMLALITEEQKEKWHELTGAPFAGEIVRHGRSAQ